MGFEPYAMTGMIQNKYLRENPAASLNDCMTFLCALLNESLLASRGSAWNQD
jgi:hypothetical protein